MPRHSFPFFALVGLACVSAATPEPAEPPIEGASSSPWNEAQKICGPLLQKGQAAVLVGGSAAGFEARAPYDSCMAHQGWAERAEVDEATARGMQEEVNQFLDEEIQPRRTKGDFERAFGAPHCHPGAPEAEICVWEFDYRSEVALQSYPAVLTCVLPEDGSPRGDASCLLDAR